MDREARVSVTNPEILARLSNLSVTLSIDGGRIRARMTRPGRPIPQEARELIAQVKPYVLELVSGNDACPACRRLQALCAGHYMHPTEGRR